MNVGDYNDFIKMSEDIAHYHHENWDGSGYPSGLVGEDIPLSAQIVSIVSEYCALTEERMPEPPPDWEQTFNIMEKDSGKKFNPGIFDILCKIHRQLK